MIIFDTKSNDNHNETKITEITITTIRVTTTTSTTIIIITTAAVISRITETATTTTEILNRGNEII